MALLQFTSFEFWSHEEEDKRISKKTLEPALRNRSKVTIMRNLRMRFWDEKSCQIWKDNNMLWREVYLPNLVVLPPREIKRRYIIVYRNWSSDMIYHRHRRRRHNPCLYFLELLWLWSCPIKPFSSWRLSETVRGGWFVITSSDYEGSPQGSLHPLPK